MPPTCPHCPNLEMRILLPANLCGFAPGDFMGLPTWESWILSSLPPFTCSGPCFHVPVLLLLLFFKDFIYLFIYLFEGKGRRKERERNITVRLPLTRPLLRTWCYRTEVWGGQYTITEWNPPPPRVPLD